MPEHEWDGTSLRFQQPWGWGSWVDLEGPRGPAGERGAAGIGGGGGGGLNPQRIPLADTVLDDDEMVIIRAGKLMKVKIRLGGGGPVPEDAVTVNGVPVTVNGEYVVMT